MSDKLSNTLGHIIGYCATSIVALGIGMASKAGDTKKALLDGLHDNSKVIMQPKMAETIDGQQVQVGVEAKGYEVSSKWLENIETETLTEQLKREHEQIKKIENKKNAFGGIYIK